MRRARLAVGVIVACCALATLSPIPAASAAPAVELTSPAAGSVVSGVVTVAFVATFDGGPDTTYIRVRLSHREVPVTVPAGGCPAGCALSATVDTVSPVGSPGSGYVVPDGPTTLSVHVYQGLEAPTASRQVTVDNKRPVVTVAPPLRGTVLPSLSDAPHSADDVLRLDATVAPGPGSTSPISSMTLRPWPGAGTQTPFAPPLSAGGRWSAALDTSALAPGRWWAWVIAVDGRGMISEPVRVGFVVSRGFSLASAISASPVTDLDVLNPELSYAYPALLPETYPWRVVTLVDGAEVSTTYPCCGGWGATGTIAGHIPQRLPAGDHVVTFLVTDSRGSTERLDVPVTMTSTLEARWTAGADGRVVAGSPLPMAASVVSTVSPIRSWWVTVDGVQINADSFWQCSTDCPREVTPSFSVTDLRPGVHDVELKVYPTSGLPLTIRTRITVDPYQPPTPLVAPGNWTGQAGPDVLSRRPGGLLWLQQAQPNGTLDSGWQIGHGWGSFTALVGPGDWNGDRKPDLLARDAAGGLWLYAGNGQSGFASRRQIGTGWGAMASLHGPGDWNGDRRTDLLARDALGRLWLYPGNGSGGFLPRRQIGNGWAGMTALVTPGDWNGDRRTDLLARDVAGRLWLYTGNGTGGFATRSQIGSGWSGFGTIVGTPDVTGDGKADLYARDAQGTLWLYPGNGRGGFGKRLAASRNWY